MSKENKGYSESRVLSQLSKKNDINISGKRIIWNQGGNSKGDVGIGSRGKIDFLRNYCGYSIQVQ
jgi:hypothetical protein